MTGKMKMIGIVAVAVFCVIAASLSYAQNQKVAVSPSVQKAATIDTGKIVDVGNALCPVTGEKVDGVHTYVYNGKSYGLCCGMCEAAFAKDPVKYAGIADAEVSVKK